jgi:signal transduction histidine kinase
MLTARARQSTPAGVGLKMQDIIRDTEGQSLALHEIPSELEAQAACQTLELLRKRLSHDLRAPLRALSLLPEWAAEDMVEAGVNIPDSVAEHLDKIKTQSARMDSLLVAIVQFIEAASSGGTLEEISSVEVITECFNQHAPNSDFTLDIDPRIHKLTVYKSDFSTVFGNLISNAVLHSGTPDVKISCRGTYANGWAIFEVSDNGKGVNEADCLKIFEPFVTLLSRDEVDSSGLGLATVKKILKAWGGDIVAFNNAAGHLALRMNFPVRAIDDANLD